MCRFTLGVPRIHRAAMVASLLAFAVLLAMPAASGAVPVWDVTTYGPNDTPCAADHVLVKFRPGTPASEVARAHAAACSAVLDEIPQIGVQIVGLAPGLSVGRAIGFYERNPNVEFVEPDCFVEPSSTIPNDPWFTYGQLELQWMGGPEAWDITTGSPSVLIAVLDSGADFNHPDLQGRLVAGWDFVEDDGDPTDTNGHGTSVTGVLGATTNNNFGIAGVSWHNPVLVVRIGGYSGYTTWGRMAQGVIYAADQGARAINLSYASTSYSSSVAAAVDYAWQSGAVTVAAAGNEGTSTPQYPAALPNVVGVSMVTSANELVYFSNYGPWVHVCAPGGSWTTMLGGAIGSVGGTSLSAPFVTGLLGLVFSSDPGLTPQEAVNIICQTADDLGEPGFDEYYSWGKINLYQAVLAASQASGGEDDLPPAVSVTSPATGAALSGTTTITATASDNVEVTQVEVYLDGNLAGSLSAPPYEWNWDTTQSADGVHVLSVTAYDAAGNVGTSSSVTVTADNTAPSAAILEPQGGTTVSGTTSVCAGASDGTTSVREVRFCLDGVWQKTVPAAPYVWNWDTTESSQGWHSIIAIAVDAAGNEGVSTAVSVDVYNTVQDPATTDTFTGSIGFRKGPNSQSHAVAVGGTGVISASLTWGGKADLSLYLYSPSGALVAASTTRSRGGSEQIDYQAPEAGTYAWEVVAASGKANYTLTVTHP